MRLEFIKILQKKYPKYFVHKIVSILPGTLQQQADALNISTTVLDPSGGTNRLMLLPKLIKEVRAFSPDVVHSLPWVPNFFSRLILKRFLSSNTIFVSDFHGVAHMTGLQHFLDRYSFGYSDYWVFPTKYLASFFQGKWQVPIDDPRFLVLPNHVNVDKFLFSTEARDRFRSNFGITEKVFLLGCAARFDAVKRLDWLINCFAALVNFFPEIELKLFLAGIGPEAFSLKDLAAKLQLQDKIIFANLDRDMIVSFYSGIDSFVLCSESEGMPLSLLEAAASGLPVLLSQNLSFLSTVFNDQVSKCLFFENVDKFCSNFGMLKKLSRIDFRQNYLIDEMNASNQAETLLNFYTGLKK